MELKVIKPFDWAHQGVRVESFQKDQVITTEDADLIRVALEEKWVQRTRASAKAGPTGDSSDAKGDQEGAGGDAADAQQALSGTE